MEHWQNLSLENIIEWRPEYGWITEEWKDIKGHENRYMISSFGRVRSLIRKGRKNEKILSPHLSHFGYPIVNIGNNNIYKTKVIHRMVAIHFIENNLSLPEVAHKDDNPSNNIFINLEWCTHLENMTQAKDRKRWKNLKRLSGSNCPTAILKEEMVLDIISSKETNLFLSKKYKVSAPTINHIRVGRTWSHLTGIKFNKKEKLITSTVLDIFLSNERTKDLAIKYNISWHMVRNIRGRLSYQEITKDLIRISV